MRSFTAFAIVTLCVAALGVAAANSGDLDVSKLPTANDGTVQTGSHYWWNSVTGDTTFKDPLEAKRGYHDDEHQQTYWVDPTTGESVWEVPEQYAWSAVGPKQAPEGADVPEGMQYYVNSRTNKTTWERPMILGWNEAEVGFWYNYLTGESRAEPPEELGYYDPKNAKHYWKDPKTGEPTWEIPKAEWAWEAINATEGEHKGKEYYHNKVTNETTWEKPAILGWSRKSPTKTYYYNQVTGEAQFERPKALGVESEEHDREFFVDEATGESTWDKPAYAKEAWETIKSDEHDGREYYHNTVTDETTWEKPEALGWVTMHEDL